MPDWFFEFVVPVLSYALSFFVHGRRRRAPSFPPLPPEEPLPTPRVTRVRVPPRDD